MPVPSRTRLRHLLALVGALLIVAQPSLAHAEPATAPDATPSATPTPAPRLAHEPVIDRLAGTVTIPDLPGLEYSINDTVVAAGVTSFAPVPFGGKMIKVTVKGVNGTKTPTPNRWDDTLPEVVKFPDRGEPKFDDTKVAVIPPSINGVQFFVDGDPTALKASSFNDLSKYSGQTVKIVAKAATPRVTLLTGPTEWTHIVPGQAQEPAYDDLQSTLTIPTVAGVEYLVDGVVTAPGVVSFAPVAFKGRAVTITARLVGDTSGATRGSWKHTFPEVVKFPDRGEPKFDDTREGVSIPGIPGVQFFVEGSTTALRALSFNDLSAYAGRTVKIVAKAAVPKVTLFTGPTEWTHAFAAKSEPPVPDYLHSTLTIPEVPGVEYLVDGVVTPAGVMSFAPVAFKGRVVSVKARLVGDTSGATKGSWSFTFPEVIEFIAPNTPKFDDSRQMVLIPGRSGVQFFIEGSDVPLRAASWENMSAYAGKTVKIVAKAAAPKVTLLIGTTECSHHFPARPDYSIAGGDEFNGDGVANAWKISSEEKPSKGKSVYRPENVSVADGNLRVRISRHCLSSDSEVVSDANKHPGVCPAGTITRYSTGRIVSGFTYGAPKTMEVRARLADDHHGITSTGWMHNDQPFCNQGTGVSSSNMSEFDVMEIWDTEYSSTFSHLTCDNFGYHTVGVHTRTHIPGAWHTWRVEWDGYGLRYFFDGNLQSGPQGSYVTAEAAGISRERFESAINDRMWQIVINVNAPPNNNWAPWIDDTKPFADRYDLYDYVRFTPYDKSACAPYGAIGDLYATRPELGRPVGCETDTSVPGSRAQRFEHGRILWSPQTGAHVVLGAIGERYAALGAESALGLPVEDERTGQRNGGAVQQFQRGRVLWSPATGAHAVVGRIGVKYAELGAENGAFGYPTTDELCGLREGGCYQGFSDNNHIYWSVPTDAHFMRGAIYDKYASMGWENSPLGYPRTDEICGIRDGGCFQRFAGNSHLYFSPVGGAHPVWGAIFDRYSQLGWENGPMGYPASDEFCGIRDGGCFQRFEHNDHIYFSPAAGTWGVQGAIFAYYSGLGWENGRLGYPAGPETCRNVPGARECTQRFQGGLVTWNSRTGARG